MIMKKFEMKSKSLYYCFNESRMIYFKKWLLLNKIAKFSIFYALSNGNISILLVNRLSVRKSCRYFCVIKVNSRDNMSNKKI